VLLGGLALHAPTFREGDLLLVVLDELVLDAVVLAAQLSFGQLRSAERMSEDSEGLCVTSGAMTGNAPTILLALLDLDDPATLGCELFEGDDEGRCRQIIELVYKPHEVHRSLVADVLLDALVEHLEDRGVQVTWCGTAASVEAGVHEEGLSFGPSLHRFNIDIDQCVGLLMRG